MTGPVVSVVVPVLDEAAALPGILDHLLVLPGQWQHVVVDGGSRDGSADIAASHPARPTVLRSARGRAAQMNAGARQATGDVVLFLHADTRLPADAHAHIARALRDPAVHGGNFALRFDGGDRFSAILAGVYALQRRLGVYYGDSAIWMRRGAFERLGGYRLLPIMEDYDLVRRLERSAATRCLPGPAVTSARRWQRLGLVRTVGSWVGIRWLFVAGAPPHRLAALYRPVR